MDKLKAILDSMRSERCPRRVLDRVEREAFRRESIMPTGKRIRVQWLGGVAVGVVTVIAAALLWPFGSSPEGARVAEGSVASMRAERVAQETYASLTSIGLALREAGSRSGRIILEETLPRVRQGLETTKQAIRPEGRL